MRYTLQQLYTAVVNAGFTGIHIIEAMGVAIAESGYEVFSTNRNKNGTIDRGPFQFNNYYHPEVSNACAYDINCSAQQAFRVSNGGSNWSQWVTWLNGSAQREASKLHDWITGDSAKQSSPVQSSPVLSSPNHSILTADKCKNVECSVSNITGCLTLADCYVQDLLLKLLYYWLFVSVAVLGVYLLFRPEINAAVKEGVKTGEKVAIAA